MMKADRYTLGKSAFFICVYRVIECIAIDILTIIHIL